MDSRTFNGVRAIEALAMHANKERWELERFEAAYDGMLEMFKADRLVLATVALDAEDAFTVRAIVASELAISLLEAQSASELTSH